METLINTNGVDLDTFFINYRDSALRSKSDNWNVTVLHTDKVSTIIEEIAYMTKVITRLYKVKIGNRLVPTKVTIESEVIWG